MAKVRYKEIRNKCYERATSNFLIKEIVEHNLATMEEMQRKAWKAARTLDEIHEDYYPDSKQRMLGFA